MMLHLILLSTLLLFDLSSQMPLGCPSEQDEIWNITWPATLVNEITAPQKCPGGNETKGNASRECISDNDWAAPNVSQCSTTAFTLFQTQLNEILENITNERKPNDIPGSSTSVNTTEAFDPLGTLINVTTEIIDTMNTTIPILPNDISTIVNILETILNITREGKRFFIMKPQIIELVENCIMIVNLMLNERHDESFEAVIEGPQQMPVSERLLKIIERVGILVALTFDSDQNETQNTTIYTSHIGRRIPVVNIFVINLESRLQNDEGVDTVSAIISSQITDTDSEDTTVDLGDENVELRIDIGMLDSTSLINPRCAFWNFTRDGDTGGFSEEGITKRRIDSNTLSCFSNHLTSFAVLVDVNGDNSNTPALSAVSYVGCLISIICLTLSILLILMFRKKIFNQVRHFIHVNLSAALLLGLILFVSGIETAYDSRAGCLIVAIFLHYFFLAAFCWMLCEAIVLLVVVEFVFYKGFFNSRKFFVLLGWGLPVLVVAISASVSHEHYGTNGRCWISEEQGAIWAFIGPMLFIVLINSIVYIVIVRQVFKSKHDSVSVDKADTLESVKASLKAAIILLPLLGVTWVFGLLAVNQNTMVFAWIFTILNSLQGLFIFLLYVMRNKKFSSMLKKLIRKNTTSGTNSSNKASAL